MNAELTDVTREVATNDHEQTRRCTTGGVDHDFRPHIGEQIGRPHTWWRCVWCHGVTCGNYGETDPCWRIYHHHDDHCTRSGITWPVGGTRPDFLVGAR